MKQFILTIALLVAVLPTLGQQLPERSAVRKGNRHYNKGRYERSIERYNEALEAVPGQWEATYDLGNALYRAERYEAAEKSM
ncbi:MAG: tetratricopeptide repeat protein, partial [Alistipes sp.]|nr:tetratricopeptide repeat protein [Alistipes sp.]